MISRQRAWQIRKLESGRCVTCGKPRESKKAKGTAHHCRKCADKISVYRRTKKNHKSPANES